MAIQEKDATSSVGQSSETTSTSSSPSGKGSDVTTYPYRSSSARHVVWRSITTPIGAIFISVVVMVALLSFGMGASLANNGNTSASGASTSTSSSSTNMGDTQTTPATTNVPNATQQYGNQLAKYTIDPDGAKHFVFTTEQVMWEVVKGHRVLAWTVNGTVPGPMIRVTAGDHVRVTLINHLPAPTAIHWHGLEIITGQDGVPGVGMKPVQPDQTYVYDFTVHDQDVGTHWYHTHYDDMTQMTGGLYGALIVDPRPGTIQAQQAIHADVEYTAFISTMPGGYYVINGKSFPDTQPILVKHGQTVHIRMIGADAMMMHPMHIHGHTFNVVAEDGHTLTQPYQKDTVQVAPGETYDMTFNAWAPPGSIYPIHCHILSHLMNPGQSGEEMGGLIILIEYAK